MDTFQKVQEIFAYNKEVGKFPYNRTGKMYPFTKKVICGRCGRHYTRQLWNTSKNGEKCPTWVCTGKKAEKYRRCDSKNIPEAKLMEASAKVLGIPEFDEELFLTKWNPSQCREYTNYSFACMTAQRSSSTGSIRHRKHRGQNPVRTLWTEL